MAPHPVAQKRKTFVQRIHARTGGNVVMVGVHITASVLMDMAQKTAQKV